MPLEFVISQTGSKQLVHDGFIYRHEKTYKSKKYWKCLHYRINKCLGRAETIDDAVIKVVPHNTHVESQETIEARMKLMQIKEMATSSQASAAEILKAVSTNVPFHIAGRLPNPALMKRTVHNIRSRASKMPNIPSSYEDIVLPEQFKLTLAGEPFLLHESTDANNKLLVFATSANMRYLGRSKHWQMDGTFKTCPKPFLQIYTLHGTVKGNSMPLLYALLPNKKTKTYKELLEIVDEHTEGRITDTCIVDFEQSAHKAMKSVFPGISIQGCNFHFMQSLWRNLQKFGLQAKYVEDSEFAFQIRMLGALAFVPVDLVIECYLELLDTHYYSSHREILKEFTDYVEETWVGRGTRNGRREPLFALEMWNCYRAVLEQTPKTNNAIEGWHHGFAHGVGISHPNLWKFCATVQKEQSFTELKIAQALGQELRPIQHAKYRDLQSRLFEAVKRFEEVSRMDYLRGISLMTQFQP